MNTFGVEAQVLVSKAMTYVPMLRGSLLKGMYRSSLRLDGVMWDMLEMFWRSTVGKYKSEIKCLFVVVDAR